MHITYRPLLVAFVTVLSFFETKAATPGSITLTSSPNPSTYGRVVSLTASVTNGATGTVTFYDGVTVLGTGRVAGGSASLSMPSLAAGNRRLRAYYSGDSNFASSSSAVLTQTVQAVGGNVLAATTYTPSMPSYQAALAAADFNNDGKPDLVWAGLPGAGILLGNGDATFQPSRTIATGIGMPVTHPLAIGDFNGDGNLDIALGQQSPLNVAILLGRGDGTFQPGITLNVATYPEGLAAADFNGDGNVDVVVMEQGKVSVYFGTGDGNFRPPVECVTGTFLMQVAVGDFNGDGKADLVVVDSVVSGVGGVKVLLGNGDGTFQARVLFNVVQAGGVVVADFDQDGLDDIAVGFGMSMEVLMGTRDGAMRFNGYTSLPNYVNSLLAKGDFNGDGKVDLVAGIQTGEVVVLIGDGAGDFGTGIQYPLGAQYPYTVVEGDFNGDGRTDIVVGEPPLGITILYGVSGTMMPSATPQSALLGQAFGSPLGVTITDTSGNPVSGVTVTYSAAPAGASAVLSSSAAVTNANGVASVTATANNTVGSYTVSASAGTLTAGFYLSNTADTPASLTTLSGTPQSAAAGMPFTTPLRVVLKDSAGQPVSGAIISYSGAGIVLSGATATTDSSGSAQLWATAGSQPGTYTVVAATGSLSANFTLTVVSPVAVSLTTSPNPSPYGQPVMLTVTVPSGISGQVTFYDGTQVLGTATITAQTASRSTISLPSGAQTVTALYSGDSSHPASRSNTVTQMVTVTPNSSFTFGSASPVGETYAYPQAMNPYSGVVGDFNGDGKADIAAVNILSANLGTSGTGSVSVLLGNGDGTFRLGINTPISGEADVIATGDFNGDGKADLAVGLANGGGITILLGNGDGSMSVVSSYAIGNPSSITVTDLNRDGRADLVALDGSTGNLLVLLGNGDGTFKAPVMYGTGGQYANSLVVADFNGDGVPDFALTYSAFTSTVGILMGNPDGTLQAVRQYPAGWYPRKLAAGDFNADGKVDLIAVESEGWAVLIGNGDGTFNQQTVASYPTWTDAPVVADFNGDGKLDVALIYGNSGSQGVLFLFGNGDGTFQTPVTYAGSSSYMPAGPGNFTGGGQAELGLIDQINHSAQLLLAPLPGVGISSTHTYYFWQGLIGASYVLTVTNNQGTATVGVITVTDTLPASLTATGIAGTGWNCDLPTLTCTRSDSLAPGTSYPPISLTVNVGSNAPAQVLNSAAVSVGGTISATASDPTSIAGSLRPTTTTLTVSPSPANLGQSVTLTAQVSGPSIGLVVFYDGATILGSSSLNLVSRSASITTNALPAGTRLLHAYYRGDGLDAPSTSPTVSLTVRAGASQGFSPLNGYTVTGNAYSIAAGDFNADGKTDLAIANGSGISVLSGAGNATFQPPVNYSANRVSTFVTSGDFNGDGKTDLVTANPLSNDVTVFLANGDGTFQAGVNYPVGTAPDWIAVGDLDGDGNADLAVPNEGSNSVTILLGRGDGTFGAFVTYPVPAGPYAAVIADFNGDSKPDLAITSSTGSVSILLGNGNGIFQAPMTVAVGGLPAAVAAGDFNGDGRADLVVANASSNNISLLLGKGDGTFQAPVSYSVGANPSALAVGDFNGDGKLDLAVGSGSGGGASTLPGNGDGTFGAATVYAVGSSITSLTVADFNADGTADLALTTGNTAITTSAAVSRDRRRAVSGSDNVLIFEGGSVAPSPGIMTSPAPGSTMTGATVTFQWSAGSASQYGLWIGSTGIGSADLAAPPAGTATTYAAAGLPTDGRTIYVRLWSLVNGGWSYNDYTYTAANLSPGVITNLVNGSTLSSSTVTFQWSPGGGSIFGLWIGSNGVGSANLAAPPTTTGTSYTATGLPTDGRTVYVRLWSQINGGWSYNDYSYKAENLSPGAITNPVNGSTLSSSTVTFQWSAGGGSIFGLWIGSTGVGSANLAAPPTTTGASYTATGLPTDGRTIYLRLWSQINGGWSYNDYTYTAANLSAGVITSPANGSTLSSSTVTFQWSAGGGSIFGLWIGSTGVGSANLAAPPTTTGASYTATGLPTDGRTIYLRLWSQINGGWSYNDYSYTAENLSPGVITSPVSGSTLSSSTVTFQWSPGGGSQFGLWIGSNGAGSANLAAPPATAGNSYTATGLPADGRTIYVRLWSVVNGGWQFTDYSYTAASPIPGVITSPVNGSTLTSSSATFQWTPGASQFGLWIGSNGVGSANLAAPPTTTGTSYTATGLPTDGRTIYVRLWSLANDVWQYNDYAYTAYNLVFSSGH